MAECDLCGEIAEFEVLVDGDYQNVCRRCLNDDMVVVEKPSKQQIDWSYKRPTVRQILSRMSGIRAPVQPQVNTPSLSILRQPKSDNMMKQRLTALKAESPDRRSDLVKKREPQPPSPATEAKTAKREDLEEDEFLDL
jgi:hypothetical protein